MIVHSIKEEPIYYINYENVNARKEMVNELLPVFLGEMNGIPDELDAIIVALDLQGFITKNEKLVLLGIHVAEELSLYLELNLNVNQKKTGVLLC